MELTLPFQCVCGKNEDCSVDDDIIKEGAVFSAVCSSCRTIAYIKIDRIYHDSEEISYTVGMSANNSFEKLDDTHLE